jgi:hypothetical protein
MSQWINVLKFVPMQIPIGMKEVIEKENKIRKKTPEQQLNWLIAHPVPYVLRDGKYRPTDHHHLIRAVWQAGVSLVYAYNVAPKEDFDRLTEEEFWAEMSKRGWFYNRDQYGNPHPPQHLPEDTRGHADDPFRSLAKDVRKLGGFKKARDEAGHSIPFAEFQWANFFRENLNNYPTEQTYNLSLQQALDLAHTDRAQHLPGYLPKL